MQFGYVTLFAAALPMASLMALANNLVELRTDAWKILTQHRRPVAQASDDIGAWHQVLGAISLLSLVTNPAVAIFTSRSLPWRTPPTEADRLWAFILIEHALLLLKFLVHILTPTSSDEAVAAARRRERSAQLTARAFLAGTDGRGTGAVVGDMT